MIENQLPIFRFLVQLGDDALILSQRLSEWCGHGPVLEQDIALTNISLDILGQARLWYQLACDHTSESMTEDKIAYKRDSAQMTNLTLVEQPNGDWGRTVMRQYLYDSFKKMYYSRLSETHYASIGEIAHKCKTETNYHYKWSKTWVQRLSMGTKEGHTRMQDALNRLWRFHHELTIPSATDLEISAEGIAPNPADLKDAYLEEISSFLTECTLTIPDDKTVITGGRKGIHTEHLGYILAEMQFLQRAYPDREW